MKYVAAASAALLATTGIAHADLSRTQQSVRVLFEDVGPSGGYVELSYGFVEPNEDGSFAGGGTVNGSLNSYSVPGFAFLYRPTENLSFALIYDQPFGASITYDEGVAPFFGGLATVETGAITALVRYEVGGGFSAYGGVRALEGGGEIRSTPTGTFAVGPTGPFPVFTDLDADSTIGFGYVVGAAFEIPRIALRVSVTYNSEIELDFTGTEINSTPTGIPIAAPTSTEFEVELPESIVVEAQTGIAPGTLVFGSYRRVFWDGFSFATPTSGEYVAFTSDFETFSIGLGRQFTENWSGLISYTHQTDGTTPADTPLSPTTGVNSVTLGAQYEEGPFTISGGVTYGILGNQFVENAAVGGVDFDGDVFAAGLRLGVRF
ncbi:MAG: outer membrane protein transport protein [Pseudomonadota bacterium]